MPNILYSDVRDIAHSVIPIFSGGTEAVEEGSAKRTTPDRSMDVEHTNSPPRGTTTAMNVTPTKEPATDTGASADAEVNRMGNEKESANTKRNAPEDSGLLPPVKLFLSKVPKKKFHSATTFICFIDFDNVRVIQINQIL